MTTWTETFCVAATLWTVGACASPATNAPAQRRGTPDELAVERIRPESSRARLEFLADDLLEERAASQSGFTVTPNPYPEEACSSAAISSRS